MKRYKDSSEDWLLRGSCKICPTRVLFDKDPITQAVSQNFNFRLSRDGISYYSTACCHLECTVREPKFLFKLFGVQPKVSYTLVVLLEPKIVYNKKPYCVFYYSLDRLYPLPDAYKKFIFEINSNKSLLSEIGYRRTQYRG